MAEIKNYMTEIWFSIISFIFLWFILTNANTNLGNAYLWAIGISLFLLLITILIFDKRVDVTFQKQKGGWLNAIFQGAIGWVAVLASSWFIFRIVDPTKANLYSIMSSFNAANPAFSQSKILNWITVSFAIGYGETMLFGRIMEFVADKFKIQINRRNMMTVAFIIVVLALSVLFALFHITAKGVASTNSLIVVGIMMSISLFMIAWNNGEARPAVILHWLANGVAGAMILLSGGILFS